MTTVKLVAVGNSTGVVLPRDILARLRVARGERLHIVETSRGIELTPYDPSFVEQMDQAEAIMKEDRDVLRKLGQ